MNFDILCRYPISVGSYIRFAGTWVDEQMNSYCVGTNYIF